jgi:hypothetical protein
VADGKILRTLGKLDFSLSLLIVALLDCAHTSPLVALNRPEVLFGEGRRTLDAQIKGLGHQSFTISGMKMWKPASFVPV